MERGLDDFMVPIPTLLRNGTKYSNALYMHGKEISITLETYARVEEGTDRRS